MSRHPPSPSTNKSGLPKHRRGASDISSRNSQALLLQEDPEPIPELLLPALVQDDVNGDTSSSSSRQTLQSQWAEALKKVQSKVGSHSSSHRSGVATDLGRPKSMTSASPTSTRTLDQWNFYPGPASVKRESPDRTGKSTQVGSTAAPVQSTQVATADSDQAWKSTQVGAAPDRTWKTQVDIAAPDQTWKSQAGTTTPHRIWKSTQVGTAAPDQKWKSTQVDTAAPDQTWKSQAGAAPDRTWKPTEVGTAAPGQTRKSTRNGSLENLDPAGSGQPWKSTRGGGQENLDPVGSDQPWKSTRGGCLENLDRAGSDQTWTSPQVGGRAAYSRSRSRRSSVSTVLENLDTDQTWKPTHEVVGRAAAFSSSSTESEDQVPSRLLVHRTQSQRYAGGGGGKAKLPVLSKAVSMREGGAHADAVLEMAHAYSATVTCGLPLALQCAACGRILGVIVQGNPGVDVAFCSACRPSEAQWKKKSSKSTIVRFCRKLLKLDRKN